MVASTLQKPHLQNNKKEISKLKSRISSFEPIPIGTVNNPPTLDRTTFGLYISVLGLVTKRQSMFDASAVRSIAPIFPGFSMFSTMRINGFGFLNTMEPRSKVFFFTKPSL